MFIESRLAEIRLQIADLPSYGYRRACALVNRERRAQCRPLVNPKRAYRVMAEAIVRTRLGVLTA